MGAGRGGAERGEAAVKKFTSSVNAASYGQKESAMERVPVSRTLLNSTLPLAPSLPSSLQPSNPPAPPPRHRCPLSATGPSEFPRARGSPLSVSSDTVIRSVGTESGPLSEARAPSFRWPSPSTSHHHHHHHPASPYPPLPLPPLFLLFFLFFLHAPHLIFLNVRK